MRRCAKCVLPESYPGIEFDAAGVCSICGTYAPKPVEKYNGIKKQIGKNGSKYDCIVPISGGLDSGFVLYQIVRKYGLSPLAYNYDNGFTHPVATGNLKALTRKLGVPLVQITSRLHFLTRLRHLKINLSRSPLDFLLCLCFGCPNAIYGGAYRIARKYGAKILVSGESSEEDAAYKRYYLTQAFGNCGSKIGELLSKPLDMCLAKTLNFAFNRHFPGKGKVPEGLPSVRFFDYNPYDRDMMQECLTQNADWNHAGSGWRFDCLIHSVVLLLSRVVLGMTEYDDYYSNLVRKGQMSREQALGKLKEFEKDLDELRAQSESTLKRLGLDKDEVGKVLNYLDAPGEPGSHW